MAKLINLLKDNGYSIDEHFFDDLHSSPFNITINKKTVIGCGNGIGHKNAYEFDYFLKLYNTK